ncbi:peptidoglycan-binding domain-containing protein [Polyangium sp. 15x6]|uniref:peptidoglycan-binding domain-containing protein n=1 Tax=Polyangium sp. 15x6 TaxID=3042687 RepID=UPI00249C58DB|nr:peptidoglycan-binding domain-containing protein [Polyangium sp. 15x6]MDI3291231.1 peptidoglycan-binding domain-containing protein [Polyangium sp. 15x6]
MTTSSDIGWGTYQQYEGPFFRGKIAFNLDDINETALGSSSGQSLDARLLAVVTSTEGGRYDAINMYDRCIVSVGLIQWCEAGQYSVSALLGRIAEREPSLLAPLSPALAASNAEFKKNAAGKYRFFYLDGAGEVDSADKQRRLFFQGCSGLKGAWQDAPKAHAKHWASCLADMLAQPLARVVQVEHTLPKLVGFCMPDAKKILFEEDLPSEGLVGAVRAAYISFAANLPAVANTQLKEAIVKTKETKWSRAWALDVLRQLTFGPKITIYPHRYKAIRPVLERLYGVDLPDMAEELLGEPRESAEHGHDLTSVQGVQKGLIALGYDLGTSGADGHMGNRTKKAITEFQSVHGLTPDGVVGPKTHAALATALTKATGAAV